MRTRNTFPMAVLLCLLVLAPLRAQETRGTLLGTVTDSSGASVPEARIAITNLATGVSTASTTNAEGAWLAPFLSPGAYSVKVEREGFKSVDRQPLQVRVADRLRVDIVLEVGQLSDRIIVTAQAPLLETASSNRGQVITGRQITDLPLASKNINRLVDLAAERDVGLPRRRDRDRARRRLHRHAEGVDVVAPAVLRARARAGKTNERERRRADSRRPESPQ